MNNKNTLSYALKRLQAQLDELSTFYTAAFTDSITDQRVVFNRLVADSFADIRKSFDLPTSSLALHTDALNTALYEAIAPLQEMLNKTSEAYCTQISESIHDYAASILEDCFSSLLSSLSENDYSHVDKQFASGIKPLLDTIDSISIQENHVEVAETLVSKRFIDPEKSQHLQSGKRTLTFEQTCMLLSVLIPILVWLFPNPLSYFLEKPQTVQEVSLNSEQLEELTNAVSKLTDSVEQLSINSSLNAETPNSDSQPPMTQSEVATPSVAKELSHEVLCTCCNTQKQSTSE